MRALWNRFALEWCRTFHPEPSWPIHGHYYCPTCFRIYPVPWHEGVAFTRSALRATNGAAPNPSVVAFQFPSAVDTVPAYGGAFFRERRDGGES